MASLQIHNCPLLISSSQMWIAETNPPYFDDLHFMMIDVAITARCSALCGLVLKTLTSVTLGPELSPALCFDPF